MEKVLNNKVVLGISACTMGCPVRYNKKGWNRIKEIGREQADFVWHPVCPEVFAGMPVPRQPIRISGGNGNDVWRGEAIVKNKKGVDVTEDLKQASIMALDILKKAGAIGYIFMEGSPSCGVYRTTLRDRRLGSPPGVFSSLLLKEGFFLIPAEDLQSPIKWWDWRRRLHTFAWLKQQEITKKEELYETWHTIKFLCQELDENFSREIGRHLAGLNKNITNEQIRDFVIQCLDILRKPSSFEKIENRLWKHYSHYRKTIGQEIEGIHNQNALRNKTELAKEMILMERKALEDGYLFGASPIIYRDHR